MSTEGKVILTITYIGNGPEGYAFLKEQHPDFFERAEAFIQKKS